MLALGLPGGWEWLVILLVALLIFGSRLPSLMRSLGKSVSEFKKGLQEVAEDGEERAKPDEPRGGPPPPKDVDPQA